MLLYQVQCLSKKKNNLEMKGRAKINKVNSREKLTVTSRMEKDTKINKPGN